MREANGCEACEDARQVLHVLDEPLDLPAADHDLIDLLDDGIAGTLGEYILDQSKLLWRDDGRVAVFYIVLRDGAVIGHGLFCQEIRRKGLLKQSTAFVLFVFQDAAYRALIPMRSLAPPSILQIAR